MEKREWVIVWEIPDRRFGERTRCNDVVASKTVADNQMAGLQKAGFRPKVTWRWKDGMEIN
jgi:hypothetical protein